YTGAAKAFAREVEQAPGDAALRYDLGDALLKAGRLGPAIASYERAFRLAPRDADIRFNLDFALQRAGGELLPPRLPPLAFKAFHALSDAELAGLHWLSCWLALGLLAWVLRRPALRERLGSWALAALALWAFAGSWLLARRALEPERVGVIVASTAEI